MFKTFVSLLSGQASILSNVRRLFTTRIMKLAANVVQCIQSFTGEGNGKVVTVDAMKTYSCTDLSLGIL